MKASTSLHSGVAGALAIISFAASAGSAVFLATMPARADASTNAALVQALASDAISMNASRALYALWKTNAAPLQALHDALDSADYQQRQLAAEILRGKTEGMPSRRLFEFTVEGLRDDNFPLDAKPERRAYTYLFNAARGVLFLVQHGRHAKDLLLAGLDSNDYQQRFLCAYALGVNGIRDRLKDTASVLIFHLRDNDVGQDACMSCSALYRLGPPVRPLLRAALEDADQQQAEAIRLLLLDIDSPPKTKRDLVQRRSMQHISRLVYDPAVEYDMTSFYFPSGREDIERTLRIGSEQNKPAVPVKDVPNASPSVR